MGARRLVSRSVAATVLWAPALLVAINGCGAHVLPAPNVPDKTIPALVQPADPPDEGEGQVIIDTTNGPASVQVSLFGSTSWTHPICATTPCAANLPYGTYNLIFRGRNDPTLESKDILQVGRAPSVFRHTMGSVHSSFNLHFAGLVTLVLGLTLIALGAFSFQDNNWSTTSSAAVLGVGAAATGAGAWMMSAGRMEITPSSSVQWAPGGPAPPASPLAPGPKQQVLRVTPTGLVVRFN